MNNDDSKLTIRKVLLVSNTAWNLYNFRRNLALCLAENGVEVAMVSPRNAYDDAAYVAKMQDLGLRWIEWEVGRASINPIGQALAIHRLKKIYRRESPSLVHHFTTKPVLYGTIAARRAGIPAIVNSVTGFPYSMLSTRPLVRLCRPMVERWWAWTFTGPDVVSVFQNDDDLKMLLEMVPSLAQRSIITRGSGVDLLRFRPCAKDNDDNGQPLTVLFVGRLIREKGIFEFLDAVRATKPSRSAARFIACGVIDPGNRSSFSLAEFQALKESGLVELPGHVDPIEPLMRQADIVVLPSYREGTPRSLLEAAAMGKPVITTDVPGCREAVVHGETGLIVPAQDSRALADAIESMMADKEMRIRMGRAGHKRMVDLFDERKVIQQTIRLYDRFRHEKRTIRSDNRTELKV